MRLPACSLLAATLTCSASLLYAAETAGRADVALQGFYMGGNQPLADLSGMSVDFQHYMGKYGLLTGKFESYGGDSHLRTGETFVQLSNIVSHGHKWRLAAGDIRIATGRSEMIFSNIYFPELLLTGGLVEASRSKTMISFFYGRETLQTGPRISWRVRTPRTVMGSRITGQIAPGLDFGIRLMRFTTEEKTPHQQYLFGTSALFQHVNTASVDTSWKVSRYLRFVAEASASTASSPEGKDQVGVRPLSAMAGVTLDTVHLTFRANYLNQTSLYLPLAGYSAGGRKGPFAELRLRPAAGAIELFASASRQQNNVERNRLDSLFVADSLSAGATLRLPGRMMVSAQTSRLLFSSANISSGVRSDSTNRLWTASLTRPFRHHHLRLTFREIDLRGSFLPQRQRTREVEDLVMWKRVTVGAAIRLDSTVSTEHRNAVVGRGSFNLRLNRINAYSYFESGKDLANQTVFATSAVSSSTFGVSAALAGGWHLQTDAFRNSLTSSLNPQSRFLLETQGVAAPIALTGLNQWTLFIRLTKQIRWGSVQTEDVQGYATTKNVLMGSVEGFVHAVSGDKREWIGGIPLILDGSRTEHSDETGRYRFTNVPEGFHRVRLAFGELPADYEPEKTSEDTVHVSPGGVARTDYTIFRLAESLCGVLKGAESVPVEQIVIRLQPSERYTTPDHDGRYCFSNLRVGEYNVLIDTATLPAGVTLTVPPSSRVRVDIGNTVPTVPDFEVTRIIIEKPTRKLDFGVFGSESRNTRNE